MKKSAIVFAVLAAVSGAFFFLRPASVHAQISPTYERALKNFFTKMRQNNLEAAVRNLWEDNEWIGIAQDDKMVKITEVKALKERYGELLSWEKLGEKAVADRYVYMYYLAVYEDGPIGFTFEVYKPERKWVFLSFDYDDESRDHVIGGTLEDVFGE